MKVRCKESFREFERGKDYVGEEMKQGVVDIAGLWFEVNHLDFDRYWEILESPKPAILKGHVETQEEIEQRWGRRSGSDPLAIAAKENMGYQEDLHKLVAARAQQIEIFKMLVGRIGQLKHNVFMGDVNQALSEIDSIRKYIESGAKG